MELEKQSEFERSSNTESGHIENPFRENLQGEPDDIRPLDLRPEYCHYRDEGCELAESCLNCPFAVCIYDEPGGKQRRMKRLRAKEIARLHINEGKKVKELSEMFGISQRTVQRALKTILGGSRQS